MSMSVSVCIELIRSVVSRHRYGELICDNRDYRILLHVFRFNPRFVEKTRGLSVRCFTIEPNPMGKGFTLYAILSDGSKVDWSYVKACRAMSSGAVDIRRGETLQAFRLAVEEQIRELIKSRMFNGKVLADDGKLYDRCEVEVHHQGKTFNELVNEFLKLKGLRLEDVKTVDIGIGRDLADPELKKEWVEFHRKHTKLAVIPKELHRRIHYSL
ncbi:MAG: hypothetical protein LM558_00460 [Thermosphaera sp.]|nr:hypothetical protein [Thermosphaera sp.]